MKAIEKTMAEEMRLSQKKLRHLDICDECDGEGKDIEGYICENCRGRGMVPTKEY